MKKFLVSLLLCGCTSVPAPTNPDGPVNPEPTPIPPPVEPTYFAQDVRYDGKLWDPQYDMYVAEALDDYGSHLMSGVMAQKDITALCPGYFKASTNQRKAFWALFVASVAGPESGYSNTSKYLEGGTHWSLGLLQLSYEDYPGHKRCELRLAPGSKPTALKPADGNAYDPKINIRCGISIWDDQLVKGRGLFTPKGQGAYWSVLFPPAAKVFRTWNKYSPQLKFCAAAQ